MRFGEAIARPLALALTLVGCDAAWRGEVVVAVEPGAPDVGIADSDVAVDAGAEAPDATPVDAGAVLEPNLALVGLGALPASLVPGTAAQTWVKVVSRGPAAAPESELLLELVPERADTPSVRLGRAQLPDLSAGAEFERTVELWVPSSALEQRYTLRGTVDPDGRIAETDERDNVLLGTRAWVSAVQIEPTAIDFGTTGLGCAVDRTITLVNRSQTASFLSTAALDAPDFQVATPALPARLDSGESLSLDVRYAPSSVGLHTARLDLEHDRVLGPVEVSLAGAAVEAPLRADTFTAWSEARVDVLVVVDDSPTMFEEQAQLQVASAAFLADLATLGIDYRVGVTTTDMTVTGPRGALVGRTPVISPDTPAAGHELALALRVGTSGSVLRRGLDAAQAAVTLAVNPTFRREEAALWVLFVSDEDDVSSATTEAYAAALVAAVGPRGAAGAFVSAVTPEPARPCASSAGRGPRYRAVADHLGGEAIDLCSFAWDQDHPAALPARFGGQRRFVLRRLPRDGTVRVFVDGAPRAEGWRLDGQVIDFEAGHTPGPGAVVRVEYRTDC